MTVITFGLAWLLAGRMLRPLHAITGTARRLSGSTLHERIALKGPRDELKELADTFDDMLGRLDSAFTAQKEFVANASHELRTPLTIIRTEIDVALSDPDLTPEDLQEMGAAITDAVDSSESLIDGLLVLAGTETPPPSSTSTWPRSRKAEVVAPRPKPTHGSAPRARPAVGTGEGEKSLLERWSGNLVENAVRHNCPDGWFSVKTCVCRRQGRPRGGQQRSGCRPRGARPAIRPLLPAGQVAQPQDRRLRPGTVDSQVGGGRARRLSRAPGARGRRPVRYRHPPGCA